MAGMGNMISSMLKQNWLNTTYRAYSQKIHNADDSEHSPVSSNTCKNKLGPSPAQQAALAG